VSERPGSIADRLLPADILGVIGGPGRRLRPPRRPGYAVAPLVLLAALPVVAAVARQGYCPQHGWDGSAPLWRACYSDLAASTETGGVGAGLAAYLSATGGVHVDQPVLSGALMSLLGGLAPGDGATQQRWYVALWAVLAVLLLGAMVWFVATTRRVRAAPAQVALAPVVALAVLLSPDIVGVALTTGGIWAWSRRRPGLAGVLLGLGVMARSYPLIVIVAIAALAVRERRQHDLRVFGQAVFGTVLGVLALWLVTNPAAISRPYATWWSSGVGMGSPWYLLTIAGFPIGAAAGAVIAVIGWVAAAGLVAVLALGSPRRPSLGALVLVGVGVVLLTGKSFPVQSSLWLVPLVAIAGTRWRDHLWWAGAEALHFVAIWLYVGGLSVPDRALPGGWYGVFLVLRLAAVGYLVWRAWEGAAAAGSPLVRGIPVPSEGTGLPRTAAGQSRI
jgi:hypothetical protein